MGLRERNAEHTREHLIDTAIELFAGAGYEAVTLEQVAHEAGVSISTLYRYFPTKDLLVITPVALNGQMATELRRRPAEEPLDVALACAVRAILGAPRGDPRRLRQISRLVSETPSLTARLRDDFIRERAMLQEALVERLGRPQDDIYCAMTARVALGVFELAAVHSRTADEAHFGTTAFLEAAEHVMTTLLQEPPTIPRPEQEQASK